MKQLESERSQKLLKWQEEDRERRKSTQSDEKRQIQAEKTFSENEKALKLRFFLWPKCDLFRFFIHRIRGCGCQTTTTESLLTTADCKLYGKHLINRQHLTRYRNSLLEKERQIRVSYLEYVDVFVRQLQW